MPEASLKGALDAWRRSRRGHSEHPSLPQLYELLLETHQANEALIEHVSGCPACQKTLGELLSAQDEARESFALWDLALPKAAASSLENTRQISSEGGRFTIEIRRHLTDANKGIVTVQASQQFRDAVEGKTVVLQDGAGRVLLEGRMVNGEVSQEIDGLDTIDYGFVIRAS